VSEAAVRAARQIVRSRLKAKLYLKGAVTNAIDAFVLA
jgi:hypothetical protein